MDIRARSAPPLPLAGQPSPEDPPAGGPVAGAAPERWEWLSWSALAVVLLVGVTIRGLVVFAEDWPRGINGGYYPVQVRAILRSGTLALPDFPLLFYVQALVALALRPFCADLGRAIVLATQLTDTVLPCLVALPVFLLARAWVPPERRRNLPIVVLCAGLVAVVNPMGLRMAGDMQKNSVALGLSLLFVYFADRYLREHGGAAAAGALAALALTGLTHLGAFGMTLVLALLLSGVALWDSHSRRRLLIALPLVALVCAAAALAVFAFFDPERIQRLAGYLLAPARLLGKGPAIGPGRPGLPGGPGGLMARPEALPGLALGGLGLWMWLLLVDVDRGQRRTALACSLAALGLACPWLQADIGMRLALMSILPGVVCVVFSLAHWPRVWGCVLAGGMVAALTLTGTLRALRTNPPGTVSPGMVAELRDLAGRIREPARTLIIARHGLEWWAAWFTGAHIANNLGAALSVWDRYAEVYSLVETGPAWGARQGGQPPLPGGMPPGAMGPAGMPPGAMGPGGMAPGGVFPGQHPPGPVPGGSGGGPEPGVAALPPADGWGGPIPPGLQPAPLGQPPPRFAGQPPLAREPVRPGLGRPLGDHDWGAGGPGGPRLRSGPAPGGWNQRSPGGLAPGGLPQGSMRPGPRAAPTETVHNGRYLRLERFLQKPSLSSASGR